MLLISFLCLTALASTSTTILKDHLFSLSFFFFFWPCCMACRILVPWLGLTSGHQSEHTKSLQLEHQGIPRDYLVSKISSLSESLDFTWSRKGSRKLTCIGSELEVLVLFLLHCTYSALFWQYQRPQILISSPSYYVLCLNWPDGLVLVHKNRGGRQAEFLTLVLMFT